MRNLFVLLTLFMVMLVNNNVSAAEDRISLCEEESQRLDTSAKSIDEKIERWESLRAQLGGTGLYEYHLGKYYIEARRYEDATEAINEGLKVNSDYINALDLAQGDIFIHQGKFRDAEQIYEEVVKKFPDWSAGYHALGFSEFCQGKFIEAVGQFKTAVSLKKSSLTYRYLALASYPLEDYKGTLDALNMAYKLNKAVLGDRDLMIVGANSKIFLGDFKSAENYLILLMRNNPAVKNDEDFLKSGLFLREKMIEAGIEIPEGEM